MSRVSRPAAARNDAAAAAAKTAVTPVGGAGCDDAEDADGGKFERLHTTAREAGVQVPPGAARSVFDLVKPPERKAVRRPRLESLDVASVVIETGLPIPAARSDEHGRHGMVALLERMQVGQSVVLSHGHAKALRSMATRKQASLVIRALDEKNSRVWRVEFSPKQVRKAKPAPGAGA